MPLRFTLRQLEYFVAVGEAGSIALASEQVNVSPPSLSAAISQLEREFGIQLFVRQHAQGLSLTPGGRRFYNETKVLLDQAHRLHDLACDIAERAGGPINVGCLVTVAPFVLAALRRSFEAAFPEARVHQTVTHQGRLLEMLRRAEIDVAITYDLEIPQDVAFEPLAELPPYVMVGATHPLAERSRVTLEELANEPMVLLDLPMSREYFLSMFQSRGLRPRIAERTAEMSVLRSLVANGYGYTLANFRPRNASAPDGCELRFVRLDGSVRPMTLGLATMRSERRARILAAFDEHCRDQINDDSVPGMVIPD